MALVGIEGYPYTRAPKPPGRERSHVMAETHPPAAEAHPPTAQARLAKVDAHLPTGDAHPLRPRPARRRPGPTRPPRTRPGVPLCGPAPDSSAGRDDRRVV